MKNSVLSTGRTGGEMKNKNRFTPTIADIENPSTPLICKELRLLSIIKNSPPPNLQQTWVTHKALTSDFIEVKNAWCKIGSIHDEMMIKIYCSFHRTSQKTNQSILKTIVTQCAMCFTEGYKTHRLTMMIRLLIPVLNNVNIVNL